MLCRWKHALFTPVPCEVTQAGTPLWQSSRSWCWPPPDHCRRKVLPTLSLRRCLFYEIRPDRTNFRNTYSGPTHRLGLTRMRHAGTLWIFDRRATQQQRQRSAAESCFSGRHLAALLLSHRAPVAMLRRLAAARQKTTRPFPIYEMGSTIQVKLLTLYVSQSRDGGEGSESNSSLISRSITVP